MILSVGRACNGTMNVCSGTGCISGEWAHFYNNSSSQAVELLSTWRLVSGLQVEQLRSTEGSAVPGQPADLEEISTAQTLEPFEPPVQVNWISFKDFYGR